MISLASATLRANFQRELFRLHARPLEGGPMCATREDALIAFAGELEAEVDDSTIARLAQLPDGAGSGRVWEVLNG